MKIFLGVAGVLALIGICFICLSIYAKKEINTPKFELPEMKQTEFCPLPKTKEEAFDLVSKSFEAAASADDVEITRHTDINTTEGEKALPFSDADNAVVSRVLENAQGAVAELYPNDEGVIANKLESSLSLGFTKADVTDFTAEKGYVDDTGAEVDDGLYHITLTLKPESIDTKAMTESDVKKSIEKELSPILNVSSLDVAPEGFTADFNVNYYSGKIIHAEIKRSVKIKATVDFVGDYKALSESTAQLEIPYNTNEITDFFNYGIHFTERQLAVQKNDMQALPLEVNVNEETTKDDYKLSVEVSENGLLEIDADGVMTVKNTKEEPLTVKATLEYDGHTYTDSLIVYATELEVKTDEPTGN